MSLPKGFTNKSYIMIALGWGDKIPTHEEGRNENEYKGLVNKVQDSS